MILAVTEPIGIAAVVAGGLALLTAWVNGKSALASSKSNSLKLDSIHIQMNSRLDELVKMTNEIAHAAGIEEGKKMQKAESNAEDIVRIKGIAEGKSKS